MVELNYFALLARRQQIRIKLTLRREDFASRGPNAISSCQVEGRNRGVAMEEQGGLARRSLLDSQDEWKKLRWSLPSSMRPPQSPGARREAARI